MSTASLPDRIFQNSDVVSLWDRWKATRDEADALRARVAELEAEKANLQSQLRRAKVNAGHYYSQVRDREP